MKQLILLDVAEYREPVTAENAHSVRVLVAHQHDLGGIWVNIRKAVERRGRRGSLQVLRRLEGPVPDTLHALHRRDPVVQRMERSIGGVARSKLGVSAGEDIQQQLRNVSRIDHEL